MKSFKEVEATRRAYHQDAALNSVHRASLMVPELAGAEAEISFVNHFLLKRGYAKVACRITAVDPAGKRIEARLFPITEPKVYTIPLTGMVSVPVATYLVDFFAADNLFIPFPAVMLNHRGPGFLNTVHAYNRVLNDVFEDDAINATSNPEASIDVLLDGRTDTFAVFTAGPQRCKGELEVELAAAGRVHTAAVALDVPRLCNQEVSLRRVFPGLPAGTTGFLRLRQPRQDLFYGRLLAGRRWDDGAFSANHSYYDSSGVAEYWEDDRESCRLYPFFADLDNVVRMYPIMSPGTLAVVIAVYDREGRRLAELPAGELESPGPRFLEVDQPSARRERCRDRRCVRVRRPGPAGTGQDSDTDQPSAGLRGRRAPDIGERLAGQPQRFRSADQDRPHVGTSAGRWGRGVLARVRRQRAAGRGLRTGGHVLRGTGRAGLQGPRASRRRQRPAQSCRRACRSRCAVDRATHQRLVHRARGAIRSLSLCGHPSSGQPPLFGGAFLLKGTKGWRP
jgi:hypothetical protein